MAETPTDDRKKKEAIGYEEMIRKSRAERGASTESAPQEQNFKGKMAIGMEEMCKRSQQERSPKPENSAVETAVVPTNEISETIERAKIMFSPADRAIFEPLFAEVNFTNIILSKLDNNRLTIMSHSYNLSIDVRAILEILAQKMNVPLSIPMELKIKVPPPFISNIKEVCEWWISQTLCEYQKIFRLNDPMIQRYCHEYWLSISYPILVRLAYTEWENDQMGWKVAQQVKLIEDAKNAEVREIRNAYNKKFDVETTILKTKHSRTEMENQELKTKVNMINDRLTLSNEKYNNLKRDTDANQGATEDFHQRCKLAEAANEKTKAENIRLQKEVAEKDKKLKVAEETEWRKDFTYSTERPVFVNALDDTTISFPCSMDEFKKNYKPGTTEGGNRNYIFGEKSFSVPLTLALKIPKLIAEPTTVKGAAEKQEKAKEPSRPPTQQKILEYLPHNPERTIEDISTGIDVAANHLYEHLKILVDEGQITKKHSDERGGNVYSILSI